jgi:hypothetical protein
LRQLLPSQQGFGTDLSASDTIIPIVDLTQAAEGSDVPQFLQTAMSFGSQTSVAAANGTVTAANTPGFYRLQGTATVIGDAGSIREVQISMSDGLATKNVWGLRYHTATGQVSESCDLYVFLSAGDTLDVTADGFCKFDGSIRQVATTNGVLVQPVGFNPQ